jgi:transposase
MKPNAEKPDALPADPEALPNDIATLREMITDLIGQLHKKDALVEHLQRQLEKLLRHRYGRKSETIDWGNGLFPKEVLEALLTEKNALAQQPPEKETVTYERDKPAPRGHGRKELPAHLERVREVVDLPEEQKTCSVCGTEKLRIREEVSEQLEYVPASLFVRQTVRPVYACPKEHEVSIAPPPSNPIAKGLAGPGLLAQIIVSKYGDHLPLNRQEDILSRHGVQIPRSTQCDWMRASAALLRPLTVRLKETVLASKVVHTDDTTVQVQEKKKTRKGRPWGYLDPIRNLAVFDYTPSRSRAGPMKFLGNFSGYLQADAYAGYDAIFAGKSVKEVACWAHARRKFDEAKAAQPETALSAMAWIKRLYDVEREAKAYRKGLDAHLSEDECRTLFVAKRHELRQEKSIPILADFDAWLTRQEAVVLPKSPAGQAIRYARGNWAALNRYAEDGDLSIDNNFAERAMRHVAIGRKNWLFFGSDRGGETWAILTSLLYSAKLHGLDLWAYMKDVLDRIAETPLSELDQFLPDVWKRLHAAGNNPESTDRTVTSNAS